MATLAESLVLTIIDKYGDDGGGGTTPANIVNLVDYPELKPFNKDEEWVVVWTPRPGRRTQVNDKYADVKHELRVRVLTYTSDVRLKEIVDEIVHIIVTYPLTGVNYQYVTNLEEMTARNQPVYVNEITGEFNLQAVTSEVGFGRYYTEAEAELLLAGGFFKTITGLTGEDVVAGEIHDTLTLSTANAILTLTGTAITKTIEFEVDETAIDHDNLLNFAADEHFTAASIISDDAYGAGWNGVTTIAPSKNAVYDKIQTIGGGGEDLAATLAIGNETDGTDLIVDQGSDLIVYSDDKITEVARIDGATGNITTSGTVDGVDIAAHDGGDVEVYHTNYYTDADAKAATVSDDAYGAGWNGVTDVAPSKNAVYDKIQTIGGGGEDLSATLAIGNETDGTDIIVDQGSDVIVYSDDKVTEVARIDGATGNITTSGTVDGVDIAAHDGGDVEVYHTNYYTDTDVENVITAELVDGQSIDNAIDSLIATHTAVASAHHVRYADAEAVAAVEAAGIEFDSTKTLSFADGGASVDIIRDEDNMASDDANALATQQSIKKYVDDSVVGGGGDFHADATMWFGNFGGELTSYYGGNMLMPAADADCLFAATIVLPANWPASTNAYLHVLYTIAGNSSTYSGVWYTYLSGEGEDANTSGPVYNSTAYDFSAAVSGRMYDNTIPLGTGLTALDRIGVRFISDTSNTYELRIYGMYIDLNA